jgi:SHS2 domain-containing protein
MKQFIAIVKVKTKQPITCNIGIALYGSTKEEALKTLDMKYYEYICDNKDWTGKELLVRV